MYSLIDFRKRPVISAGRPGRVYIEDGEIRLIFQDDVYVGWYRP